MSLTTVINYDNAANFTFDSSKIEFVGSTASLKIINNTGQIFNQPFTSSVGFTFNAAYTEFVAGKLQQKDQTPTDSRVGASYTTDGNANWNKDGSTTGNLNGAPTFTGGKMVCTGTEGLYYDVTDATTGAIKFIYTPNYTTTPPANINLVSMTRTAGNNDRLLLTHSPSGNTLRITLSDNIGTSIYIAIAIGPAFTPTASTDYEIELDWDSVIGTVRVFIDGVLHGTLVPGAWARTTGPTTLNVGADPNAYNRAEASFDDVIYFNVVQHTVGYSPGYTVPLTIYQEDTVTFPNFTYSGLGNIQTYDTFATTQTGSIKFNVNGKYWNGSAWVASDDSYAQMNTVTEMNTNLSTLTASDTVSLKLRTTSTNSLQDIDVLDFGYTGQIYPLTDPTITINSGTLMDALEGFTETSVTSPAGSAIQYILKVSGQDKWWSGAAWVNSNGTYAESNIAADIETNKASLSLTAGETVKLVAFLHSDTGAVEPTISTITIDYNFFVPATTPTTCIVYGWVLTTTGAAVSGATVKVSPQPTYNWSSNQITAEATTTTSASGYWELELAETQTVAQKVRFDITNGSPAINITYNNVTIPNVTTKAFNLISTTVVEN